MLAALAVVTALAAATPLDEAQHALSANRLAQARLMVEAAEKNGASGPRFLRLRADIDAASGRTSDALRGYESLLALSPSDPLIAELAGIASARLGDVQRASRYLAIAAACAAPTWRTWNAVGVLADRTGDWSKADAAYARAAALAPDEPSLLNNRGWSQMLRGNWQAAVRLLEQGARRDPADLKIANNLQLARAATAESLPARAAGEDDRQWAARLNDAGMAALTRGDRSRAIAAFSRAIAARDDWYERAANNLRNAESAR